MRTRGMRLCRCLHILSRPVRGKRPNGVKPNTYVGDAEQHQLRCRGVFGCRGSGSLRRAYNAFNKPVRIDGQRADAGRKRLTFFWIIVGGLTATHMLRQIRALRRYGMRGEQLLA